MANPIIDKITELAKSGLHPSNIRADRDGENWTLRISLDDWIPLGEGESRKYAISLDRENLPEGISVRAIERWPDETMDLPFPREVVEAWINQTAEYGKAPDVAHVNAGGDGEYFLTKPVIWLREPLRSALTKKAGK